MSEALVPEVEAEVKEVGKVVISVMNNGSVSVQGPVNNVALMMDIFGGAMKSVAIHNAKAMGKKE